MERRIVAQLLTCMDDLGAPAAPAAGSARAIEAPPPAPHSYTPSACPTKGSAIAGEVRADFGDGGRPAWPWLTW